MAQVCQEIQELVEREILEPIIRKKTGARERCRRRRCIIWCLCCNKWFCWIETFIYWVFEWVVRIIGVWVTRVICETIIVHVKVLVVTAIISLGVVLIVPLVVDAVINSFSMDGLPVHGNWCGPGHGGTSHNNPPPTDAVDAACMRHDLCYNEKGYFSCECDLLLLAELPTAIATEAERGNVRAVSAGEAIMAYFTVQTSKLSCPIVKPIDIIADIVDVFNLRD